MTGTAKTARNGRLRIRGLGVEVTPMSVAEVLSGLEPSEPGHRLIVGHNLHSVYLAHTDREFAQLYDLADTVLVDGQPVRWAGKLASNASHDWHSTQRVGSVDWIRALEPRTGLERIAVVGAGPESNRATVDILQRQTGAEVAGWHGLDWSARAGEVVERLNAFDADLTLIGLGMPLQESFYMDYRHKLPAGTYALVGGAIDQICGVQRRAPAWIGRVGLEWLWRLARSPRRLGYRYLVEPVLLLSVLGRVWASRRA